MKLSIVSPAYNEEKVLPYYFKRVRMVCDMLLEKREISDYEIILVDDGYADTTWNIILENQKTNPHVRGIKLSRNFGHHSAITAGLSHSSGDLTILMDSDLQAEPENIPAFINKFKSGFDILWGIAKERKGNPLVALSSKMYYWLFNKISRIKIPNDAIMIASSRKALDEILELKEVRQFTLAQWTYVGFQTAFIEIERKERLMGTVKYTFLKRINLALISIVGYSKVPLKISSLLGFIMSIVGISSGLYILIKKLLFGISVSGYASLFTALTFLFGIHFLIMGIMGEYMGIVIDEVKSRPRFIIEEIT